MTDRLVIVDAHDQPRYILEGDEVRPHPEHRHLFRWFSARCRICQKTKKEIEETE